MAPALFTTGQSRWALHILVALLSAVAIASSAPSAAGGASMYSGNPGDIRGLTVMMGSVGLGGVLVSRLASLLLPRPWHVYLDRLEFTFVTMLWICWTSATMAFSAFTLDQGVCSSTISVIYLPTCPLLTFDLALLHLLSTATLALLLVILSTALSPSYYLSLSTSFEPEDAPVVKPTLETTDVFVMWELALASSPPSPRMGPVPNTPAQRSYGTHSPVTPSSAYHEQPANPYVPAAGASTSTPPTAQEFSPPEKRDKFAEGRIWSYLPLAGCSIGAIVAAGIVLGESPYVLNSVLIMAVAITGLCFSIGFLWLHFRQRHDKAPSVDQSFLLRHDRAVEVGLAGALFLLWPLAAIIYTLFPPTPNRPCANPSASSVLPSPLPSASQASYLCLCSSTVIALAWLASWIILARVLGLIFPMPEMGKIPGPATPAAVRGDESQSLLRSGPRTPGRTEGDRPKVQWGRMVAGEAFELGGDDED